MSGSVQVIDDYLHGRRAAWFTYGVMSLVCIFFPWMVMGEELFFVWDALDGGPFLVTVGFLFVSMTSIAMIALSRAKLSVRRRARIGLGLGCAAYLLFMVFMAYGLAKMNGGNNLQMLGLNVWFPVGLLVLGCGCVMRSYDPTTPRGRILIGAGVLIILLFFLTPPDPDRDIRIALYLQVFMHADQLGQQASMYMMISSFYLVLFGLTMSCLLGLTARPVERYLRRVGSFMLYFTPFLLLMVFVLGTVLSRGEMYPLIWAYASVFILAMNELAADGCIALTPATAAHP